MKLWRWLVAKWWVVYGIGVIAFIVLSTMWLVVSHPDYDDNEVNYLSIWWSGNAEVMMFYSLLLLVVIFGLYVLRTRNLRRALAVATITFVVVFVWLSLLDPYMNLSVVTPRIRHVSSVDLEGHRYNLASYASSNFPGSIAGYVVYKCDSVGINCQKLHQAPFNWMLGTPEPRFEYHQNNILFYLNDELLFQTAE